jgi:hypothetical protein
MQAFQPRPIQLPGGQPPQFGPSSFGDGDGGVSFAKMMRIGLIAGLVVLAVTIVLIGRSYSTTQRSQVTNQNIRPLGAVHTSDVQVTMPLASEIVSLPLFIQGTARLDWFSDGIFPIEVRDGKNNILATTYAIADIADPESQIANFRAVVEGFDVQPQTRIGRIILYRKVIKSNPAIADIASIGIDFSSLGAGAWMGNKEQKTETETSTKSESTGVGPNGVWSKTVNNKTTEQNKTVTQTETQKKYDPYQKYTTVVGGPFTCANGIDDDKDGTIDSEDPSCHTDGYPANNRSYDGDLDEAKRAVTERDEYGNLPGEGSKPTTTEQTTVSKPVSTYNQQNTVWQGNAKIRVQEVE